MRKFYIIYVLNIFFIINSFSQNFKYLHPQFPNNNLFSINFFNDNNGFITGIKGLVLKTNDEGASWENISIPTNESIYELDFINDSTYVVEGGYNYIAKTVDYGENWVKVDVSSVSTFNDNVDFANINVGFFIDSYNYHAYRTGDGGINWNEVLIQGVHTNVSEIKCISDSIVFFGGQGGKIYKSSDSGISWTTIQTPSNNDILNIFFISENIGFCGTQTSLMKTIDGGTTWFTLYSGSISHRDTRALDEQTLYTFKSSEKKLLISNNGGVNWINTYDFDYLIESKGIYFKDINNGFILTGDTESYMKTTNDAGITWQNTMNSTWSSILATYYYFITASYRDDCVYLVTGDGKFIKSDFNYENIEQIGSIPHYSFNDITDMDFFNDSVGIACASNGSIKRTINGGVTWNSTTFELNKFIYDLSIIDENTALVFGQEGLIWRTTNQGQTWTKISSGVIDNLFDSYFIDNQIGFAVAASGYVFLKTVDGGINWTRGHTPTNQSTAVYFINENIGFVAGELGNIYKTTNGGNTWIAWRDINSTNNQISHINFFNDTIGYATGAHGILFKTTNAGGRWEEIFTNNYTSINKIHIAENNTVYLFGDLGTIITNDTIRKKIPDKPVGEIKLCKGNNSKNYSTQPIENASNYIWEISPVNSGTILSNMETCNITFNPIYTGIITLKVAAVIDSVIYNKSEGLEITIFDDFDTPIINVNKQNICPGDTAILTVLEGYNYLWSNNETLHTIYTTIPGTFYVQVSDTNGCFTKSSNSIIINELESPSIPIISGDTVFCEGQSTIISTSPEYVNYFWSTGDEGLSSIEVFVSDTIYLTVQNIDGCEATSNSIHTLRYDLISKPTITQIDNNLIAEIPINSFNPIWYNQNNEIVGTSEIYAPSENGFFYIEIENSIGCKTTSDEFQFVLQTTNLSESKNKDIQIIKTDNGYEILSDYEIFTINVYSELGQLIYSFEPKSCYFLISDKLLKGNYLLKINNGSIISKKLNF